MKKIYDAIAYGQTLHPDEGMGSEEETEDGERSNYNTIQDRTEAQQLLGRQLFIYYRCKPKRVKGLEKIEEINNVSIPFFTSGIWL